MTLGRIGYIHPGGHLNDFVVPAGAVSCMNAIKHEKAGVYAFELSRSFIESLSVAVMDWHWGLGFAGYRRIAKWIRKIRPDLPIVAGGITTSVWPRALIDRGLTDYAIQGDAEEAFVKLMDALVAGRRPDPIPNVWEKGKGAPKRARISQETFEKTDTWNCDWFPTFKRSMLSAENSFSVFPWIFAARGCVGACSHCYGSYKSRFGPGVLYRSPENLIAAIDGLRATGAGGMRLFLGHLSTSRLRAYLTAMADSPFPSFDTVGFYCCNTLSSHQVRQLRSSFPQANVTYSMVNEEEISCGSDSKKGFILQRPYEDMQAAIPDEKMEIEVWSCYLDSRRKWIETYGHIGRNLKSADGTVWLMPRPDMTASDGPQSEIHQRRRVLTFSENYLTFQSCRYMSPALALLAEYFKDCDDIPEDPLSIDLSRIPAKLHLYWELFIYAWKHYHAPVIEDLSWKLVPLPSAVSKGRPIGQSGAFHILGRIPDFGSVLDKGTTFSRGFDPRGPSYVLNLPRQANPHGYVILPSLDGDQPDRNFLSLPLLHLQLPDNREEYSISFRFSAGRCIVNIHSKSGRRIAGDILPPLKTHLDTDFSCTTHSDVIAS